MDRGVEAEWLDALPVVDPGATGSRRDLQRLNAWMGNAGTIARALRRAFGTRAPRGLLDVGAGDGWLMLRVARQLPQGWKNAEVTFLDRQDSVHPEVRAAIQQMGWRAHTVVSDATDFFRQEHGNGFDAIIVNLFLHHLDEKRLRELLGFIGRQAEVLVAVEPRRSRWSLAFSRLVWLLGCNRVTRHDAPLSVRAGFSGTELSRFWPRSERVLYEGPTGWFSHLFVARGCGA